MTLAFSRLKTLLGDVAARREAATSMALFRICLGLTVLFSLWLIQRSAVLEAIWADQSEGGIAVLSSKHWLFQLMGGLSTRSVNLLYQVSWISAGLVVLGLGGRVSVLVCQQVYVALTGINGNASGGSDSLLVIGLLLLLFTRPTATLSLDRRLRHGTWTSDELVAAWPRALAVFQILFVYTLTGLQKIGLAWTPFGGYRALHYVMNDPTWVRWDLGDLPWTLSPLLRMATALTWHWEQCSLLLLLHWYYRAAKSNSTHFGILGRTFLRWDWRVPWASFGLLMHLGIVWVLDVGPFSPASVTYYVCLWGPNTWVRLLRRA